jgi:outer membrane protein assembly factor BamB
VIRTILIAFLAACAALAGDWLTFGADNQRSGWAKDEEILNKDNVAKLKLEWKIKLPVQPRELHNLTTPVVVNPVITPGQFKELAVIASADNQLFAIDTDAGKIFWQKKFDVEGAARQQPGWLCPNSLTATPVIEKTRERNVYVIAADGKLHALNLVNGEYRFPPKQFTPPYAKAYSPSLVGRTLYAPIGQGCNGNKNGIFAVNLDDPNGAVTEFRTTTTGGAGIWGRAGAAIDSKGRPWVETGDGPFDPAAGKWADSFLVLEPKTLKLADYYTPANRAWITKKDLDMGCMSPIVFKYKSWELVAGGGKEGVLYLLDAAKPGGDDHRTPLYRSPLITNEEVDFAGRGFWGAFSTWEDEQGTRWLYAPAWGPPASAAPKFPVSYGDAKEGSIMAFKIVEKDGKPFPEAAWISREMKVPEPVAIAGGVVFAISSGEYVRQVDSGGRLLNSKERVDSQVGKAVLYALDAKTGKELWNSGSAIESFTHFGGVSVANGRVYLTDFAGNAYAFGLME